MRAARFRPNCDGPPCRATGGSGPPPCLTADRIVMAMIVPSPGALQHLAFSHIGAAAREASMATFLTFFCPQQTPRQAVPAREPVAIVLCAVEPLGRMGAGWSRRRPKARRTLKE